MAAALVTGGSSGMGKGRRRTPGRGLHGLRRGASGQEDAGPGGARRDGAGRWTSVNLFGPAASDQLALPYMREKRGGRIVNLCSICGRIYTPLGSWYRASKHAVEGWSDCLRIELAPFGIDVIVIETGVIETEFIGRP
jgi:NAD(P)-dependent dehydrogenase (short-subunit alcohol dehydrogenase family)